MKYCGDYSFEKEVSDLKKMIDSGNDYFNSKYFKNIIMDFLRQKIRQKQLYYLNQWANKVII
jgi:hypothetical protein